MRREEGKRQRAGKKIHAWFWVRRKIGNLAKINSLENEWGVASDPD